VNNLVEALAFSYEKRLIFADILPVYIIFLNRYSLTLALLIWNPQQ